MPDPHPLPVQLQKTLPVDKLYRPAAFKRGPMALIYGWIGYHVNRELPMTWEVLASACGVSRYHLVRVLEGDRPGSQRLLRSLEKLTGLSPDIVTKAYPEHYSTSR